MTDTDANYPRDLTGYGRTLPHAQRPFCDLCCGLFSARQIASALTPTLSRQRERVLKATSWTVVTAARIL